MSPYLNTGGVYQNLSFIHMFLSLYLLFILLLSIKNRPKVLVISVELILPGFLILVISVELILPGFLILVHKRLFYHLSPYLNTRCFFQKLSFLLAFITIFSFIYLVYMTKCEQGLHSQTTFLPFVTLSKY